MTADEIIVDAGPAEARKKAGDEGGDRPLARLTQHDRYRLKKYWRTNQDTAINQRPLVRQGQKVKLGDVLAESIRTQGILSPLLVRPLTENGFEIVYRNLVAALGADVFRRTGEDVHLLAAAAEEERCHGSR